MTIILVFFETSYLVRFVVDIIYAKGFERYEAFENLLWVDLMFLCDGLAFLALLIFHYKNFKPVDSISKSKPELLTSVVTVE